jgi:hypothetical protein
LEAFVDRPSLFVHLPAWDVLGVIDAFIRDHEPYHLPAPDDTILLLVRATTPDWDNRRHLVISYRSLFTPEVSRAVPSDAVLFQVEVKAPSEVIVHATVSDEPPLPAISSMRTESDAIVGVLIGYADAALEEVRQVELLRQNTVVSLAVSEFPGYVRGALDSLIREHDFADGIVTFSTDERSGKATSVHLRLVDPAHWPAYRRLLANLLDLWPETEPTITRFFAEHPLPGAGRARKQWRDLEPNASIGSATPNTTKRPAAPKARDGRRASRTAASTTRPDVASSVDGSAAANTSAERFDDAELRQVDRDRYERALKVIRSLQRSRRQPWTHQELAARLAKDQQDLRVTSRDTVAKILHLAQLGKLREI